MKRIYILFLFIALTAHSFAQNDVEMLGQLSYNQELSDIWGYVDEDGNEYALVGVYNGFSVVDVTNPASPEEVHFIPGPQSIWRDIKTFGNYAYISNESSQGVLIVDLSPLPDGEITNTANFTGSIYDFQSAHNLYIDEFGKMYIFGADNGSGGAIICDISESPMNPVELGRFNNYYLHDGMARGDTLWGAAIYQGQLLAIDVSNPSSPSIMGSVSTPGQFAHNCWVSDDGTHVFTTDEISNGYIGAFNVEDMGNMYETDRVQSSPGQDVIPHNVHVRNDFLITSYYRDGIVIHDAANPENITLVGSYDTSPNYSGSGFNGSWGAYPFLPSGNILASDIEEGLYILGFNFVRAAFVQGVVTDTVTGDPLFNVQVEVLDTDLVTQTLFDGSFEFSALLSGNFDLQFTKTSYETKIIEDVAFVQGEITALEVELAAGIAVSVEELTFDEQFEISPNPSNSEFMMSYQQVDHQREELSVTLFSASGQVLGRFSASQGNGMLRFGADLPSGIYFVGISDGISQTTKRVVKY
jgi:choice-of-anchor B domain-containing protein